MRQMASSKGWTEFFLQGSSWFHGKTPFRSFLGPYPGALISLKLLVWLALYPSVMSLSLISVDTLGQLLLVLNMLISTAIAVAIAGCLLVPLLAKAYEGWLQTQSNRFNMAGGGSILGMLLVFYALFSSHNLLNWLSHSAQ